MTKVTQLCLAVAVLSTAGLRAADRAGVYMANGIKITQESAIVWTRLTRNPERNVDGLAFNQERTTVPAGRTLEDMEGSVPGRGGEDRLAGGRSSGGFHAAVHPVGTGGGDAV